MFRLKLIFCFVAIFCALSCQVVCAQNTGEDQAREAAIAEFTKTQQAANWPEKFSRIGNEMGVPADVLAAVAFAETRWEQLKWPAGETTSPETGAPRGYGVMFLQDNDYFGHSLVEAAQLIGKTPDELKDDPELNIRGAAALLKKIYDENPKPDFAKPEQIESWYNAVIKYCGIPEPFLSHQHALNSYVYMSKGYNQYGMHWTPHPVNLKPMQDDVIKLRAEFDAQVRAKEKAKTGVDEVQPPTNMLAKIERTTVVKPAPEATILETQVATQETALNLWPWLGVGAFVCIVFVILMGRRKKR